jgi:polar amino acid transport system substrate-binding protein
MEDATLKRGPDVRHLVSVIGISVVILTLGVPRAGAAVPAQADPPAVPHLRVVTKLSQPFVFRNGSTYTGFSIDLLNELTVRVPFTYSITAVSSVNQQLQAVEQGRADLAIAAISITSARERSVDFTYPYFHSGLQVMTSTKGNGTRPSFLEASFIRLLRPFAIVLLCVLVMAHLQWLLESRRTDDFPGSYLKGVGEGLWWAAVTLTTVGYGDRTPRTVGGRTLAVLWMVVAIVLLANLTASLTTSFTVQELRSTINGPNDLAGRRVATLSGTTASQYLQTEGLSPIEVPNINDAYRLLENQEVAAVVYDSPTLLYYAKNGGKGAVQVVGGVFDPQDYGIALPLGSQFRKPLDEAILSIIEDGTYARIHDEWFGTG